MSDLHQNAHSGILGGNNRKERTAQACDRPSRPGSPPCYPEVNVAQSCIIGPSHANSGEAGVSASVGQTIRITCGDQWIDVTCDGIDWSIQSAVGRHTVTGQTHDSAGWEW